jgi:hypothetical protein
MNILLDPKFFNYLIMSLYFINSARWLIASNYGQFTYWAGAFIITYSVTFMVKQ